MKRHSQVLLSCSLLCLMSCAHQMKAPESDPNILRKVDLIQTETSPDFIYAYKQSKFVPPEGKTLLMMGQTVEAIDAYVDAYSDQPLPGGWAAYWGVTSLAGIERTAKNETGSSQNHEALVDRFPNSALHSALWMVGKWDVLKKASYGQYDTVIKAFARWAKGTERPIYLRIGYEFDGAHNALDPELYIKTYRRIVDLIRSEGANNIAFVWHSYAAPTYEGHPLEAWYPGDEYVDWVGISLFGHLYADALNPEGEAVFAFAKARHKPVMVAEASPIHGIDPDGSAAWDTWFVRFFSLVYERNVKAISFINENWPGLNIEGIAEWRDARLQNNDLVYRAWFAETNKARYLKQSPELFELLGYEP